MSKIVYELNFYRLACYFIDMNKGDKATFFYPLRTSRSGRRAHCQGQTLVEYALILAIISIVAIGVMISLGQHIQGVYSSITSVVASAAASH